jgi:hypothetical protein
MVALTFKAEAEQNFRISSKALVNQDDCGGLHNPAGKHHTKKAFSKNTP